MLIILDVQPDDSGLYYCDGEPVVYLSVIKDESSVGGERREECKYIQKKD